MRNTLAVLVLKLLFKYYFNIKSVAKGKLAHEFSTCYLECISFTHGEEIYGRKKCEKKYITHAYKEKKTKSGNPINVGFQITPLNCDVIRWGIPIKKKMEFLCC